VLIFRKMS